MEGYTQTVDVYDCADCSGCEHKSEYLYRYNAEKKVYKEFMLYAIGRNILKYHRFLYHEIEKYEGKKEQKTA